MYAVLTLTDHLTGLRRNFGPASLAAIVFEKQQNRGQSNTFNIERVEQFVLDPIENDLGRGR